MLLALTDKVAAVWRNLPLRIKGLAALGVPACVLIVGLQLFLGETRRSSEELDWIAHVGRVRERLGTLGSGLLTMESAARGYVISPRPEFRTRFITAKDQVAANLDGLAGLVSDNQTQEAKVAHLREVVSGEISAMEALLAAAGRDGSAAMIDPLLQKSAAAMEPVRSSISEIDATEAGLEQRRMKALEASRSHSNQVVGLTVSTGLITLMAGFFFLTHSLGQRMKSLQLSARALRKQMPLQPGQGAEDEIGQVQSELERASEVISTRTRALRASEEQLRTILDNTKAMVYIKDLESRFVLVNSEYERVFGLTTLQGVGRGPVELFGQEFGSILRANDLSVIRSRQPAQFREKVRRNGRELTYISVKVPLLDAEGVPYGICGISTDITGTEPPEAGEAGRNPQGAPRKTIFSPGEVKAEPAANENVPTKCDPAVAEALGNVDASGLERVAGDVARDFASILGNIIGYSRLLLADVAEGEREHSPAGEILRASERAADLTRQLFALDQTVPTRPEVYDVASILKEVEAMASSLAAMEAITVRVKLSPEPVRVKADRAQIEQLLLNLIANARDAMPTGGTIRLSAAATTLPAGTGTSRGGDFISISVCDEGLGIPPHIQDHIFEPFFTTKRAGQGSGLGLTISAMIAQQNGGWMACRSEVGSGSVFTVYLPQIKELSDPEKNAPPRQALKHGKESVLVVEDEPTVGEIEALVLRNLGYRVTLVESSEEAESSLQRSGPVDLVLTDQRLPGVSGQVLIDRIRAQHPETKFILTSGSEFADRTAPGKPELTRLAKPFEIDILAETVRQVLDT